MDPIGYHEPAAYIQREIRIRMSHNKRQIQEKSKHFFDFYGKEGISLARRHPKNAPGKISSGNMVKEKNGNQIW
jgi:hypothetical protein